MSWLFYVLFIVAVLNILQFEKMEITGEILSPDQFCPPFGNDGDRFVVDAISEDWPRIGGCANKLLRNRIDFWLGSVECDNLACRYKEMDHYVFECFYAWNQDPINSKNDDDSRYTYIFVEDRMSFRNGHKKYRCGIYTVNDSTGMIRLVISDNRSCEKAKKWLSHNPKTRIQNLTKMAEWDNGFLYLRFSKSYGNCRPGNKCIIDYL